MRAFLSTSAIGSGSARWKLAATIRVRQIEQVGNLLPRGGKFPTCPYDKPKTYHAARDVPKSQSASLGCTRGGLLHHRLFARQHTRRRPSRYREASVASERANSTRGHHQISMGFRSLEAELFANRALVGSKTGGPILAGSQVSTNRVGRVAVLRRSAL